VWICADCVTLATGVLNTRDHAHRGG